MIDEVPWARLHHAYGPATDVPGQLRALRSADSEVRADALGSLRHNVHHQGTRWQASAATVRILISIADDPTTSASLTLAHLPTTDPRVDEHLRRKISSPYDGTALTAAVALAYRLGPDLPPATLTVLIEATDRELPDGVLGRRRALRGFVFLALQRLGLG